MIIIEGCVEEIVYTNEENGYTICEITCEDKVVTIVGYLPYTSEGEYIKATGDWTIHRDYGRQFKVESFVKTLPDDPAAIERYLSTGAIKGVGRATAKKIVRQFKEDSLKIIVNEPQRLAEIKGLSIARAMEIGRAMASQRNFAALVSFLQENSINPVYASKMISIFGDEAIKTIKDNPYTIIDHIAGIDFKNIDEIAAKAGIARDSKLRIVSGIKYLLMRAALNGHTYLPLDEARERALDLLNIGIEPVNNTLVSMKFDESIVTENDNIYLKPYYMAELRIASKLAELASARFIEKRSELDELVKYAEDILFKEEGIIPAEMQKDAIREALSGGITIITGGPGTGKTTIIKGIIKIFENMDKKVELTAPTGRAAKRMSEATGHEARTLHRLLKLGVNRDEIQESFFRGKVEELDSDVIIVDEMSMVDVLLMDSLLDALNPGTRLVLVGDIDQLPSVGPGNVLKDIIRSGKVNMVVLKEVFRQAEESLIVVNAHKINNGEFPVLDRRDKDFFFIERRDQKQLRELIVDLAARRLPAQYGYDPFRDIQILTPVRKGILGVREMNLSLQEALNPKSDKKKEKAALGFTYREGDKVMQIRNNYNLRWEKSGQDVRDEDNAGEGVFNGDTGIITHINEESSFMKVVFDEDKYVDYYSESLDELDPAYAITIHKSQGSEFPVVILPVFSAPRIMLTRNLLYTAITRARDMVIVAGSEDILKFMVRNNRETMRYTGLLDKINLQFELVKK